MEEKEIWKDIKGYEGLYKINRKGEVYSCRRNKIMSPSINSSGYKRLCLTKDNQIKYARIHRLVAENFLSNQNNKPCINHINGIKTDNNVENLEWVTHSENTKHAYSIGNMSMKGENHSLNILSRNDVIQIRSIADQGWFTAKEISNAYNVHWSQIYRIIKRTAWRSV